MGLGLVFPKSSGPTVQQAPIPQVGANLFDERIAAQLERMQKPRTPMYTPEQIQERRSQNDREYQLGLLGMLSGQDSLGEAGGMVFKNALAKRQAKITERGQSDPITGEFTYDPDYLAEKDQAVLEALYKAKADQDYRRESDERHDRRYREIAASGNANRTLNATIVAGGGGLGSGSITPIGEVGGNTVFKGKSPVPFTYGPTGQPAPVTTQMQPKAAAGGASEDERKAAGWLAQSKKAFQDMRAAQALDPQAAQTGILEKTISAIGGKSGIGEDIAFSQMTPARQQFTTAAGSLAEAVLRAATGAGVNHDEAMQKVRELTPRYGEHPSTTAMKEASAQMYIQSLQARAGRAVPAATAPGGAAENPDPLGMRRK